MQMRRKGVLTLVLAALVLGTMSVPDLIWEV